MPPQNKQSGPTQGLAEYVLRNKGLPPAVFSGVIGRSKLTPGLEKLLSALCSNPSVLDEHIDEILKGPNWQTAATGTKLKSHHN